MKSIPLARPHIPQSVFKKLRAVLNSGFLTEGPVTRELEESFCGYVGCRHALAVPSATVGLEFALRALGIGPGDEVVVPDFTYPATADVVAIVGAKVVLVDISRDTLLIDYDALERAITRRTKAIMPVSEFGNPLDYPRLENIRKRTGVAVIEDAACAIGASLGRRKTGAFADITVFSLHPRKIVTTGEGGMITTNSASHARWIESYKHFGMVPREKGEGLAFDRIGTNGKMCDLQAAVGLAQMERIDEILERRRFLAQRYLTMLDNMAGVKLPQTTAGGTQAYQSFCVFVENREGVLRYMRSRDVEVQIGTYSLHLEKAFSRGRRCRWSGRLDNSTWAYHHCLALPLFHEMTLAQQQRVVVALKQALEAAGP